MSEAISVRLSGLGKMYKLFSSRSDNLLDALGLGSLVPWRKVAYREFWALRGIDLELKAGQRLGIIGRNGAGKSTLLKLITGNLTPTEGTIEVNGQVQALLDAGTGFHPDFNGYENLRSALTYQGLTDAEIAAAEADIADFTELGGFLEQPFKTYSAGMQARLAFATATAIQPEVLLVDEILGAGDAYFFAKSASRMRRLVDGGASILIVSHALDQIVRFCEHTIWMDRGRIVMHGPSVEVVKAYEKFTRELEDRRLRARNEKARIQRLDAFQRDSYTDYVGVKIRVAGEPAARCDIRAIALLRDGELEDRVRVGDAQDADSTHSAFVEIGSSGWSPPMVEGNVLYRSISPTRYGESFGSLIFHLWFFYPTSAYAIDVTYRCLGTQTVVVELLRNAIVHTRAELPATGSGWRTERIQIDPGPLSGTAGDARRGELRSGPVAEPNVALSRWPGSGTFHIDDVRLLDETGTEQGVFTVGRPLTVCLTVVAHKSGTFPLIPAVLVFRDDGILASRHVGGLTHIPVSEGDRFEAKLEFGSLQFGNATYLLTAGLYSKLDLADVEPSEIHDVLDRSFEFRVVGNPALHNEFFRHPGTWHVVAPASKTSIEYARAAPPHAPSVDGTP